MQLRLDLQIQMVFTIMLAGHACGNLQVQLKLISDKFSLSIMCLSISSLAYGLFLVMALQVGNLSLTLVLPVIWDLLSISNSRLSTVCCGYSLALHPSSHLQQAVFLHDSGGSMMPTPRI